MPEHQAPHSHFCESGTRSASQAEIEASRIERLNLAEKFARARYVPSRFECADILGIPVNAAFEVAQERFRTLSMLFHPDTTPLTDPSRAGGLFGLVRRAWDELRKSPAHEPRSPDPSEVNADPASNPFNHESYTNDFVRGAREMRRIRETLDGLTPEVGFLLCNYIRANVLKTMNSVLKPPHSFSGRDGPLRRAHDTLEIFNVLKRLTTESYVDHAGLIVAQIERRLAPILGVKDHSDLAHRVGLWASTLGFDVSEVKVITSSGMVCAQCFTEVGALNFPSIHDGIPLQELEPWVFGSQAEVYRKIQPRLSESTARLVGAKVPIFIDGVLNDDRYLESLGVQLCTARGGIRGDYRDRFDGVEIRTYTGTFSIPFDPKWIRSVCISVSGGSQELLVEFHPSSGEVTPPVGRYNISKSVVGAARAQTLPGTIVLASDTGRIGNPAPPLSLHRR